MLANTAGGCLPAAVERLCAATAALVDPSEEMHENAIVAAPSLYEQLDDAITTSKCQSSAHRASRSMPPVWIDALDLRVEIDDTTREWQPDVRSTPVRLRTLAAGPWRPQDTRSIDKLSGRIESWCVSVKSLLNPTTVKHVSAACPACGATTVYKRDSGGERVRVPALQIVAETGCTCQACRHTWGPELYLHLARVLGFESPPGVLE